MLQPRSLPFLGALVGVLLGVLLGPVAASSQDSPSGVRPDALRVFIDCRTSGCDNRFLRTEIRFVNWVQDVEDAQVYVIATGLGTGSGGNQSTLEFIGREVLDGSDDELNVTSLGTDTEDEVRAGFTRTLAIGLARYATLAGVDEGIEVMDIEIDAGPTDRLVTELEVDDPWNFWVFEFGVNGRVNGEDTRSSRSFSGDFGASRTTEGLKFEFDARGSFSRSEIELSDSTIVDDRTNWNAEVLAVFSVADHWSVGVVAEADASTRSNQDLGASLFPALEYSYFPYEEAPRRSLTARYDIGVRHLNYEELTIFGELSETRPQHRVTLTLFQQQPWGSSFLRVTGSQYLHDLTRNSVRMNGNLSFRVARGLRVNAGGSYRIVDDQLFVPARGLTDEEILLERRTRATESAYSFNLGFSFQFGSIFNNVVNNRF